MKYHLGHTIGNLTITDWNVKKAYYTFECTCGRNFIGTTQTIKFKTTQLNEIGFTGCKVCTNAHRRKSLSDVELFSAVFGLYKNGANRRKNVPFEISLEQAIPLFKADCHYCGDAPANVVKIGRRIVTYQGIDRIDSALGYTTLNVVPCCKKCNYAKHVLSYSEFINHIKKIYENVQRLEQPLVDSSESKWEAPDLEREGDDIV
jgi:hypothetical protein